MDSWDFLTIHKFIMYVVFPTGFVVLIYQLILVYKTKKSYDSLPELDKGAVAVQLHALRESLVVLFKQGFLSMGFPIPEIQIGKAGWFEAAKAEVVSAHALNGGMVGKVTWRQGKARPHYFFLAIQKNRLAKSFYSRRHEGAFLGREQGYKTIPEPLAEMLDKATRKTAFLIVTENGEALLLFKKGNVPEILSILGVM